MRNFTFYYRIDLVMVILPHYPRKENNFITSADISYERYNSID